MVSAPLLAALAAALVVLAAEALHARRIRRVAHLAFGPAARPAAWVGAAPVTRAAAMGLAVFGALTLLRYEPAPAEEVRAARASKQLLICLDVSPSMLIADAGTDSRKVTRARWAAGVVRSILDHVDTGDTRVSLIAFYTKAMPVLTDTWDRDVVSYTLGGLPLYGAFKPGETDAAAGVDAALEMARPWARGSTTLVIVSDGDTRGNTPRLARPASIADVLVVGVGDTRRPSQIGSHASRQDAASLRALAARLRGRYIDANRSLLPEHRAREFRAALPRATGGWSDRERGLAALGAGSLTLAGLGPLLNLFGAKRRPVRAGAGTRAAVRAVAPLQGVTA